MKFAKSAEDWKWWNPCVPSKLRELDSNGYGCPIPHSDFTHHSWLCSYNVIVISNQGAIALENKKKSGPKANQESKSLANFKTKLKAVSSALDIPMSVYAATKKDRFRKPCPGIWAEILETYDLDDAQGFDQELSIFVGDAAGREGDHSASDRYDGP